MLKIKSLYAGYTKGNAILKGIHLNIKNDEVVGILGRNGSGKSTLAKSICGMVPNIDGDILLNGDSIIGLSSYEIAKKGIGFFQQGGRVFQNLSIEENLYFAIGAINSSERRERINELSNLFELLKKSDRLKLKASYLSGGEKHQLSLAMILIQKPKFLILDEPSAGLSPSNAVSLYEALFSNKRNTTTLLIEQNVPIAKQYCQKLIKMEELHQLQ